MNMQKSSEKQRRSRVVWWNSSRSFTDNKKRKRIFQIQSLRYGQTHHNSRHAVRNTAPPSGIHQDREVTRFHSQLTGVNRTRERGQRAPVATCQPVDTALSCILLPLPIPQWWLTEDWKERYINDKSDRPEDGQNKQSMKRHVCKVYCIQGHRGQAWMTAHFLELAQLHDAHYSRC